MTCVNCGHSSLVRSNFKLTYTKQPYCIKKCSDAYAAWNPNAGARQKGEKVE